MTDNSASSALSALFLVARSRYETEWNSWIQLSFSLSAGVAPAIATIQRQGDLDLLLRCLESERRTTSASDTELDWSLGYQIMFSEQWILGCYEFLRSFNQRYPASHSSSDLTKPQGFDDVFHDFECLRMPLAKFELPKDRRLKEPLPMGIFGSGAAEPIEHYDPKDPMRVHKMPTRVSKSGSVKWFALDTSTLRQYWVERRDLSDRLLSLVGPRK
jgi:hypothetical protein